MDPVSRRHLWDLIASVKKQCAVVLTTHSMEEADILGDCLMGSLLLQAYTSTVGIARTAVHAC